MPVQMVYATAALLFAALFPLPAGYLEIIHVVVFGTFGWGAYRNLRPGSPTLLLALVYAVFAVLFNPLSHVSLPDPARIGLCIAGAILLVVTRRHIAHGAL
ncbi:MAG: hypothetical protein HGB02_08860 [Chlorobiaceae bacterium]|nr:hypothetical protein [Chlorobiaceae bacterium]